MGPNNTFHWIRKPSTRLPLLSWPLHLRDWALHHHTHDLRPPCVSFGCLWVPGQLLRQLQHGWNASRIIKHLLASLRIEVRRRTRRHRKARFVRYRRRLPRRLCRSSLMLRNGPCTYRPAKTGNFWIAMNTVEVVECSLCLIIGSARGCCCRPFNFVLLLRRAMRLDTFPGVRCHVGHVLL